MYLNDFLTEKPCLWLFDGTDGAGKTTILNEFAKSIENSEVIKFPTVLPHQATGIKKLLYKTWKAGYYLWDFYSTMKHVHLNNHVILDRSYISTLCYQGFNGKKRNWQWYLILGISHFIFGRYCKVFVHVMCDPEEANRRIESRGIYDDAVDALDTSERLKYLTLMAAKYTQTFAILKYYYSKCKHVHLDNS